RDVNGDGFADFLVGAGPGGNGHVKVFDGQTGTLLSSFLTAAGDAAEGRYSLADLNRDGLGEVPASSPGQGRAFVLAGAELSRFSPYAGYTGVVSLAAGDVNGDASDEIFTGAINGHVKVFRADQTELRSFLSYPGYAGGVNVAAGDLDGDDGDDVLTIPSDTAAHVKALSA